MKRLVTVVITSDEKDKKFDYYESETGFFTTLRALWAVWRYGNGAININEVE